MEDNELQQPVEQIDTEVQETQETQAPTFDIDEYFSKTYGVSLSEAEARYNEAVLKTSLAEAWDVSPKEALRRLEIVLSKLPEEERETYNSIDGVVKYWEQLNAKPAVPPVQPLSLFNKQTPKPATKSLREFTKEEIRKDVAAYHAALYEELRREGYNI